MASNFITKRVNKDKHVEKPLNKITDRSQYISNHFCFEEEFGTKL